jgi:signal transduction histidine kinase/DNA-binding NarL/FixJ family response regulator
MEERILVLDDEPGITLLCNRLLKKEGYQVAPFTSAAPAIEYLRTNHVDLLLVDIRMPDIDGFEVIECARKLQPDIAVLVMTGFGTVETAIQALRRGVDGLLLKPFEKSSELVDSVRQSLVDSEKKHDAARIQALRPLFSVTESFFSETHPERLLSLIIKAIRSHLHCACSGYYQYEGENLRLLLSEGSVIDPLSSKAEKDLLLEIEAFGGPVLVNCSGPGNPALQSRLQKLGFGAVLFVPVARLKVRSVLFAGRAAQDSPFRESDMEMFLILASQAVVALENARLYAELRDYVKQVEESQQALLQAEKMAAAGRLTASIAHEVNNPLQAVQNCLHLAGRQDLSEEQRTEYFELAKTELNRLMSTVQRMLDFYRPGAVAPSEVSIPDVLAHVMNLMSQQLEKRGIDVQVDVPASLPSVFVVSSQIQQVFINLILNAFDAMPEGGSLQVHAHAAQRGVEILFQDNGPGVSQDRLARIFEPFYSTKSGGTGLGLTVSYNIITAHGGSLELVSNNKPGACFRVYLPTGGKR